MKILEKAVHIQLYAYLKNNEIITSKQFGFRPKLSTGTALAHFTDNILLNMDAGSFVDAVFLDLSKAFDTVDHHLQLQKLTNIGLTSYTTQWFRSYLINRSQITLVGDADSAATKMPVCLGMTFNQSMSWADHIDAISMKTNQRIGLIRRIRNVLPLQN